MTTAQPIRAYRLSIIVCEDCPSLDHQNLGLLLCISHKRLGDVICMIGGLTRGVRIKPNDGSGNTNDQQTKTDIVDQFCDSQYGSLAASNNILSSPQILQCSLEDPKANVGL